MICGVLRPTQGALSIHGRVAALLELGAGFNPEFTGAENIRMNAAIMGLSRSELESRFADIVAFAAIGDFIDQPVKTYSSGMQVRLAFATAINVSPDILVVDEALAVGDARFQQKCMARIKGFCQSGTVVFVSHDTSAVLELCSRVLWIEKGTIRMDGPPKAVVERYLEYMYEGDNPEPPPDSQEGSEPSEPVRKLPDMESFVPVDGENRQFGNRSAEITGVRFRTLDSGNGVVYSDQPCELAMTVKIHADIPHPIIGFIIKDRLGRNLIGDNTALLRQNLPAFQAGKHYLVRFDIPKWPNILEDDYLLSLAVADGDIEDHVQCHWIHDVLLFKSIPDRRPAGIFSVSDTRVECIPLRGSRRTQTQSDPVY
jgi:lipopolysaccharide transport system ATP-binding protein